MEITHLKLNLVCLLISITWIARAGGISVKWGTSGGPIVPPTPAPPTPPPQPPYRAPAPAWEDQSGDIPNPNPYRAPVLQQFSHFFPTKVPAQASSSAAPAVQPISRNRYTHIVYNPQPKLQPVTTTLSPAKAFVNAYAQPSKSTPVQNIQQPTNAPQQMNKEDYTPEENYQNLESRSDSNYFGNNYQVPQLGVRYIPGFGYKYFTPEQDNDPRKYDHSYRYNMWNKHNALENNDIFDDKRHQNDLDLSYEKELALRVKKSPSQYYVPQQPINNYNQQLFYPANFPRH